VSESKAQSLVAPEKKSSFLRSTLTYILCVLVTGIISGLADKLLEKEYRDRIIKLDKSFSQAVERVNAFEIKAYFDKQFDRHYDHALGIDRNDPKLVQYLNAIRSQPGLDGTHPTYTSPAGGAFFEAILDTLKHVHDAGPLSLLVTLSAIALSFPVFAWGIDGISLAVLEDRRPLGLG
jgi:hypothetical protein